MHKTGVLTFVFALCCILLFAGCSQKDTNRTKKIVVSNWIGYMPLLYGYEKGSFDKLGIELIITNSLQTSLQIMEKNKYDGIALTQREYDIINSDKTKRVQLIPIALLDRSYGGDAILSNIPKEYLFKNNYNSIKVFLEKESINVLLFEGFKKLKDWGKTKFILQNMNQSNILQLPYISDMADPEIIITYEPYLSQLKKKGLHLIESTKNDKILVFDFLAVRENLFTKKEIIRIQNILYDAVKTLQSDTKEFYQTVKVYLGDMSYEEFRSSLNEMIFVSKENLDSMIKLILKEKILKNIKELKI
jgi:NitT/TauT family transport system substrate-binding protein